MDARLIETSQSCRDGAERSTMTFPQIASTLMSAGFEGYAIDFRRRTATYYLPDGDSTVLPTHADETPIANTLDTKAVRSAIREAQQLAPGYSYRGFCAKVKAAGCAGYVVSFAGRRAVYIGRTGEVHTEHFPQ